ncbi:DUF1800 domain-containing protein [Flavitalea antarctica]
MKYLQAGQGELDQQDFEPGLNFRQSDPSICKRIMSMSNLRKNLHLMWRAGFGPALDDLETLSARSPGDIWREMLRDSSTQPPFIDVADASVRSAYEAASLKINQPAGMVAREANEMATGTVGQSETGNKVLRAESERRMLAQRSRENIKTLNITWLDQMVTSKQQLREKLSLFWHGHFATNSGNILYQQKLLDIIRVNSLGNFGTLLKEVSRSASMINYLNNNQNRKNRPNENFAREVMELFTLGRGNYSENDIREAARAFTGWGAKPSGEFIFRSQQHDSDNKTFLGRTGNFDGDNILDILLEQKQTAYHITKKIYKYFVNDRPDEKKIRLLADKFYSSRYDISKLLDNIFASDWFYEPDNIGNRIKSPVELLVGVRRTLGLEIRNPPVQLLLQKLLGQTLLYPPNVAGWPGGYNWIDSSSLMLRLQIPKLIVDAGTVNLVPKDNDDQMMGMKETPGETNRKNRNPGRQVIQATINWNGYLGIFDKTKRDNLVKHIAALMLVPPLNNNELLSGSLADSTSRESFIKSTSIQLMCIPEYQLC